MTLERKRARKGWFFVSPLVLGLALFVVYPVAAALYYSFCDYSPLQGAHWIGGTNYAELAVDGRFHASLSATFGFALIAIPLGVITAFLLALLLQSAVRGLPFYRAAYYLPHLVPTVVTAILWQWMYRKEDGLVNTVVVDGFTLAVRITAQGGWMALAAVALASLAASIFSKRRKWPWILLTLLCSGWIILAIYVWHTVLREGEGSLFRPPWYVGAENAPAAIPFAPSWALWSIIFMSLWGTGQMAIIYLAKLQEVPAELYEAADIDGASAWHKLWHITIPMASPLILFNVVMGIIGAFQVFTEPYLLTGGGPEDKTRFVALFLYDQAFLYRRMGYASAVGWVLFVIALAVTLGTLGIARKRVYYAAE